MPGRGVAGRRTKAAASSRTRAGSSAARRARPARSASPRPRSRPRFGNYAGRGHARQRVQQATWTSPVTNRLLLDAGFGTNYSHYGGQEVPGNPDARHPAHRGAVRRRRARGQHGVRARHLEPDVRLAGLDEQPGVRAQLARLGVVRHRRAQHEVRLPGALSPRESELRQQRHAPHLPLESRHPEPADDGSRSRSRPASGRATRRSTRRSSGRSAGSRCRARCASTTRGATSPISRSGR